MKLSERLFDEVLVFDLSERNDNRGTMNVNFLLEEMKRVHVDFVLRQQRIYRMPKAGCFFGIHYQLPQFPLAKLVTVIQGKGLDYVVDLRRDSATFKQWKMLELSGDEPKAVYIPAGFGHAFLAVEDNTIQLFSLDGAFSKGQGGQLSYLDPEIGLILPKKELLISEEDSKAPLLSEIFLGQEG